MALTDVEGKISEQRHKLSDLEYLGSEPQIIQQVASERGMQEREVMERLQQVSSEDARAITGQLNAALETLADLQRQRERHATKFAKLREIEETALESSVKAATYGKIIEKESASQQNLEVDRGVLREELAKLAIDRIPFDFWASALAQKSHHVLSRASSPPSSSAASFYTFREFVLEQSLAELNTVTTQVLAILFENSRLATALTTGMLRSLFIGDSPGAEMKAGEVPEPSAAALDSSLSVDARLSYGKRSGGERKRIDLALFFALLYVGHARSPHRAHYMLFDEVFDSLDAAGQAAVMRWCDVMAAARVTYIIVTTHSEHLTSQGLSAGESAHEGGSCGSVLSVKMGKAGVEFEMDGRRVG